MWTLSTSVVFVWRAESAEEVPFSTGANFSGGYVGRCFAFCGFFFCRSLLPTHSKFVFVLILFVPRGLVCNAETLFPDRRKSARILGDARRKVSRHSNIHSLRVPSYKLASFSLRSRK